MFRQLAGYISNSAVSVAELSHNRVCCRCLCSPCCFSGWTAWAALTALAGIHQVVSTLAAGQRSCQTGSSWSDHMIGPGPPCTSCCQVSIHGNYLLYFGFTFLLEWTLMPPWGGRGNGMNLFSVLIEAIETDKVINGSFLQVTTLSP